MTSMTTGEFVEVFQRFADSPTSRRVFRWESLQTYAVDQEDASLAAFRAGTERPERSIRTDPWLARIARSTLAGKEWLRVRYVSEPRTEYTDWELVSYVESQTAGERIYITLDADPANSLTDFWLFTGDDPTDDCAVLMHYDDAGVPREFEYRTGEGYIAALVLTARRLEHAAMPLNAYLAAAREVTGAR